MILINFNVKNTNVTKKVLTNLNIKTSAIEYVVKWWYNLRLATLYKLVRYLKSSSAGERVREDGSFPSVSTSGFSKTCSRQSKTQIGKHACPFIFLIRLQKQPMFSMLGAMCENDHYFNKRKPNILKPILFIMNILVPRRQAKNTLFFNAFITENSIYCKKDE